MSLRPNARTQVRRNRYKVAVDAEEGRRRREDNMVEIRKTKREESLLKKRQTSEDGLFPSSTLTQDPSKLIQLDPLFMSTGASRYRLPEKLECLRLICETALKPVYLVALLKSLEGEKCIVFTSSVEIARRLCKLLNFLGDPNIKAEEYSGGLNQAVRSKELKAFRKEDIQVLVSSDALTRGMDVEGVTNVINYDMPQYPKTFIHRAGQTARAGHARRCFTLLSDHEVRRFSNLLKKVGNASCPIYRIPPTLFDPVRAVYEPAMAKLKESVESDAPRKRRQGFMHMSRSRNSQTKRNKATSEQA